MKRNEFIALSTTVIAALIIILLLSIGALSFDPSDLRQPPRPMAELVEIDEEFVDFFDEPLPARNPASAIAPEDARRTSEPAEASGHDLTDAGDAASPQTIITTEKESPLQTPKKKFLPLPDRRKRNLWKKRADEHDKESQTPSRLRIKQSTTQLPKAPTKVRQVRPTESIPLSTAAVAAV